VNFWKKAKKSSEFGAIYLAPLTQRKRVLLPCARDEPPASVVEVAQTFLSRIPLLMR
jgi:hypothetical protein